MATTTTAPDKPVLTRIFIQQFQGTQYLRGRNRRCITFAGVDPDEVWRTLEEALLARYASQCTRRRKVNVK